MTVVSEVSLLRPDWLEIQKPRERIQLRIFSEPCSSELIVKQLASIAGLVDVYFWYEGSQCLPQSGAVFMKEQIFDPLYELKQDAKLCLYSLRAWDFKRNIATMASSTPLGEAINRINTAAIECIYSSSFFRYCTQVSTESDLYAFIRDELPKKEWLFKLSETQRKSGTTISAFFNDRSSLFDCIKDLDVSSAYSLMQYVEGYYLIRESVKKGLLNGQKRIEIAFVLPNDESKYYVDLPKDIEKMLQLDFGKDLTGVEVNISFRFFQYGGSVTSRPYIDKRPKALKVESEEIGFYFSYLTPQPLSQEQPRMPFLRDVIHNLNGWY
jgi:hypothetical protein